MGRQRIDVSNGICFDDRVCPLCIEVLDKTERDFYPCPCGYQVCLFCFDRLKNDCGNLCPGCRTEYGSDNNPFAKKAPSALAAASLAASRTSSSASSNSQQPRTSPPAVATAAPRSQPQPPPPPLRSSIRQPSETLLQARAAHAKAQAAAAAAAAAQGQSGQQLQRAGSGLAPPQHQPGQPLQRAGSGKVWQPQAQQREALAEQPAPPPVPPPPTVAQPPPQPNGIDARSPWPLAAPTRPPPGFGAPAAAAVSRSAANGPVPSMSHEQDPWYASVSAAAGATANSNILSASNSSLWGNGPVAMRSAPALAGNHQATWPSRRTAIAPRPLPLQGGRRADADPTATAALVAARSDVRSNRLTASNAAWNLLSCVQSAPRPAADTVGSFVRGTA